MNLVDRACWLSLAPIISWEFIKWKVKWLQVQFKCTHFSSHIQRMPMQSVNDNVKNRATLNSAMPDGSVRQRAYLFHSLFHIKLSPFHKILPLRACEPIRIVRFVFVQFWRKHTVFCCQYCAKLTSRRLFSAFAFSPFVRHFAARVKKNSVCVHIAVVVVAVAHIFHSICSSNSFSLLFFPIPMESAVRRRRRQCVSFVYGKQKQ